MTDPSTLWTIVAPLAMIATTAIGCSSNEQREPDVGPQAIHTVPIASPSDEDAMSEPAGDIGTELCCGIPGRRGCIVSLMQLMQHSERFHGHVVDTGGYLTQVAGAWELTLGPLPVGPRPRGTGVFLRIDQPEVREEISRLGRDESTPIAVVGMFESGLDTCSAALNGTITVHYVLEIDAPH